MVTSFREFVTRYYNGSLEDDAGWRAYDFHAAARRRSQRYVGFLTTALKTLGYDYRTRSLSLGQCCADYGLATPGQAQDMLIMWRIFVNLQNGLKMVGLPLREITNVRD